MEKGDILLFLARKHVLARFHEKVECPLSPRPAGADSKDGSGPSIFSSGGRLGADFVLELIWRRSAIALLARKIGFARPAVRFDAPPAASGKPSARRFK
ncbi:MAG TPA: hypothetical protein VMV10_17915, partial [Pirellulales bacterium]|nr:hypothetical protein [Pirellulales bacterium]